MALTDYTIDTSGTPQDMQRRQAYAEALLKQGGDNAPIASAWQGVNRLAQGLLGGYQAGQLRRDALAQKQQEAALMASFPGATSGNPIASAGTAPQALSKSAPAADTAPDKIYNNDEPSPLDPPSGDDRRKMIATILGEAGNEPQLGKNAVASVIRTRAVDGGYGGNTPSAVVTAPNQFEPWNTAEGRARMAAALNDPKQYAAADAAIASAYGEGGKAPEDPTEGMTHFYSPKGQAALGRSAPAWAGGDSVTIGGHVFNSPDDNAPSAKPVQVASNDATIPASAQPTQGQLPTAPQVAATDPNADKRAWALKAINSNNPRLQSLGVSMLEALNKPHSYTSIGEGHILDNATGETKQAYQPEDKTPTSVSEYKFYKDNFKPSEGRAEPLDFAGFLSAKKAGMGTDSAYSPELLNSLADRLQAGDATWKTGMARIPGLIKAVEEEVAHRGTALRQSDPEAKPAETILQNRANQAGRVKEQSTLGTASANNQLYGNAAASTMQTAIEKSAAVPRGKFVPINKLMQMGESQISDPALAELRTATNTLVNDYAKAITPTGAPTLAAQEHARELLDMATSHETYERVVRLMHREIENTHHAIEFTKKQLRSGGGGEIPALSPPADKKDKPATVIQNGHTYELQPDGSYK